MESEFSSNQKRASLERLDRINNLPGEVIDRILKHVPIRDIVGMSILSRSWRYRWMPIPELIFDARSIPPYVGEQISMKLVNSINHVLFLHNGVISRFEVNNYLDNGCSDVDRWILFLSRKMLKSLVLVFKGGNHYKVPSCFFSCQHLTVLRLQCCILKSPSHFKGFNNLLVLFLRMVTLTSDTFESLVFKSPMLQSLVLIHCDGLTRLHIYAPNLRDFYFSGSCEDIIFGNAPQLASAVIGLLPLTANASLLEHHRTCRLDEFLGGLAKIQKLFVLKYLMEFLAVCIVPERLSITYHHLKFVHLSINFEDTKQILTTLCLCRSSPYLQEIDIISFYDKQCVLLYEEHFWKARLCQEIIFRNLKTVNMTRFKGVQHELGFVQFILINAVLLETLSILWEESIEVDHQKMHVLEKMMQFQRASPKAKVIFVDHPFPKRNWR